MAAQTGEDVGEALEAEARRRAQAEAIGARVTIRANRERLRRSNRQSLVFTNVVLGFALAVNLAIGLHWTALSWVNLLVVAFVLAEMLILNALIRRRATRQADHTELTLTDDGIDLPGFGLVLWGEIWMIRDFSARKSPFLTIHPHDPAAVRTRLGKRNGARESVVATSAKRTVAIRSGSPFFISEASTGIPTKELLARIEEFRTRRGC